MSSEWIAIAVSLVVAFASPIAFHFAREGYVRRQLEDMETKIQKGFEYDKLHFAHADRQDIHKESMDKTLIESKFENMGQRMEALGELVETKIDNVCDRLTDLTNAIKKGNGHA